MTIAVILKNEFNHRLTMSISSKEENRNVGLGKIPQDAFPIIGRALASQISESDAKKLVKSDKKSLEEVKKRLDFLHTLKTKDMLLMDAAITPKYFCYETEQYIYISALASLRSALNVLGNPKYVIFQKIDNDTDLDDIELYQESENQLNP